jgi:hypothetical protein
VDVETLLLDPHVVVAGAQNPLASPQAGRPCGRAMGSTSSGITLCRRRFRSFSRERTSRTVWGG